MPVPIRHNMALQGTSESEQGLYHIGATVHLTQTHFRYILGSIPQLLTGYYHQTENFIKINCLT